MKHSLHRFKRDNADLDRLFLAGANSDIDNAVFVFRAEVGVWPKIVVHFLPGEELVCARADVGKSEVAIVIDRLR
ncbi:MAG TPA: hypothetical protein VN736_08545 [Candidatus Limnocylindrales bacterium]|nr:hypothetical protein [Candidatus Limnocylindrales bacterium]